MDYVAEAMQMFGENDYRWKNAFAFDLHQVSPRLAVEWAILCTREIGERRFPDRLLAFENELAMAEQYLDAFPQSLEPEQLELEIWYRPNRDEMQTAISKLFSAIRQLHQPCSCHMTCSAVVSNLVQHDWLNTSNWGCRSDEMFELVLKCYRQIRDSTDRIVG